MSCGTKLGIRTPGTTAETAQADELPPGDLYHLLQNERRRALLRYVSSHDGPVELGELAEHIASLETGVDPSEVPSDARRRVYISLHQTHVDKLAKMGVIEANRGIVRPAEGLAQLQPYLKSNSTSMSVKEQFRFSGFGFIAAGFVVAAGYHVFALPVLVGLVLLIGVGMTVLPTLQDHFHIEAH